MSVLYRSSTGETINVGPYVIRAEPGLQLPEPVNELDSLVGISLTRTTIAASDLKFKYVTQNTTTLGFEVSGIPISNTFTIATMPDATSVLPGTVINVPRSEFTTSTSATVPGMAEDGIYLKASDGKWIPAWPQIFAAEGGYKASPLETYSTSSTSKVRATLPSGEPIIPKELYSYVGFRLRTRIRWGTTGTVGGAVQMYGYWGNAGTYTNNPIVAWGNQIALGATNRQASIDNLSIIRKYVSSSDNVLYLDRLPANTTATITTDDGLSDSTNKLDFSANAQFQIAWAPASASLTTGALYGYELWIG